MTAGIPRRRNIMNSASDRLKHGFFNGNRFPARNNESFTSLISSAWPTSSRATRFQRARRKCSMCLNAIVFTLSLERSSRMPAPQKDSLSSRGEGRNSRKWSINPLHPTLGQVVLKKRQRFLLTLGSVNLVRRGEIIDEIRDHSWVLDCPPDFPCDI